MKGRQKQGQGHGNGKIRDYLEALVESSRGVSGEDAHEHEQQQDRRHETPPVGGGEEAQHGEHHGNHGHADELGARAHVRAQEHRLLRRPEYISMHLQ